MSGLVSGLANTHIDQDLRLFSTQRTCHGEGIRQRTIYTQARGQLALLRQEKGAAEGSRPCRCPRRREEGEVSSMRRGHGEEHAQEAPRLDVSEAGRLGFSPCYEWKVFDLQILSKTLRKE